MKSLNCLLVSLLLIGPLAGVAADRVVLAVPARHDLVNLGFDFVGMFPRAIEFVCHAGSGDALNLERFDAVAGRWMPLSRGAWASLGANQLVLVGDGADVGALKQEATWARQSSVVDGRRLHEVANAVNGFLRLTPAQWRRLSKTYGFTLEERNVEERRYGRYGPPGGRPVRRIVVPLDDPVPVPPAATGVAPAVPRVLDPAPVVETVTVAPVQPEAAPQPEPKPPARPEIRPEDK